MKFKAVISSLLLTAIGISSTGCSLVEGSDSLLRPPKITGDEAEIEQLIADTAQDRYTLKYPKNGNYRSAIIMNDIDGDEVDEAIAFFRQGEDITKIHMLLMHSDNGKWKISSDFVTETTDIDCVDFSDINGDKTLEILVGYATYTPNTSFLSCYKYSSGQTTQINVSNQNYSSFYCSHFNSDGMNEVMLLSLYTTEAQANATMLEYNKNRNSLNPKATVPMDPNVIKYKSVLTSDSQNSPKSLVIDGEYPSTELCTQVIYYNKELSLLRNPLYSEKKVNASLRSCSVTSSDPDKDMTVEFPSIQKLPHSKNEEAEAVADMLTWNSLGILSEKVIAESHTIVNYSFNYTIRMSDGWLGKVTAINNLKNNSMTVCEWNRNAIGKTLFEIRAFDISDWETGQNTDEYTLIYKDNKYAYTFINSDTEGQLSLTDDEIKTAFSTLSETAI